MVSEITIILKNVKTKIEFAKYELNKLEQDILLSAAKAYYNFGFNFKNFEFNKLKCGVFRKTS